MHTFIISPVHPRVQTHRWARSLRRSSSVSAAAFMASADGCACADATVAASGAASPSACARQCLHRPRRTYTPMHKLYAVQASACPVQRLTCSAGLPAASSPATAAPISPAGSAGATAPSASAAVPAGSPASSAPIAASRRSTSAAFSPDVSSLRASSSSLSSC